MDLLSEECTLDNKGSGQSNTESNQDDNSCTRFFLFFLLLEFYFRDGFIHCQVHVQSLGESISVANSRRSGYEQTPRLQASSQARLPASSATVPE